MIKKPSAPFTAFLQATGLVVYIIVVALFLTTIGKRFQTGAAEFYAPIIMLLTFVVSAVISGVLVLGRAGILFWEKKYRESFTLLGWAMGWGIFYL